MSALDVVFLVLASAALLAAAAAATVFAVRYRPIYKETREGRHLFRFTVALALTLWGTALVNVVPVPLHAALAAQAVLFAWLAFELFVRNRLLTLNQREHEGE